jgi:hypothetical protein
MSCGVLHVLNFQHTSKSVLWYTTFYILNVPLEYHLMISFMYYILKHSSNSVLWYATRYIFSRRACILCRHGL